MLSVTMKVMFWLLSGLVQAQSEATNALSKPIAKTQSLEAPEATSLSQMSWQSDWLPMSILRLISECRCSYLNRASDWDKHQPDGRYERGRPHQGERGLYCHRLDAKSLHHRRLLAQRQEGSPASARSSLCTSPSSSSSCRASSRGCTA